MEELCEMGDAVLADPQGPKQVPVPVNEAFNNALEMEMETFESDTAPHPVESPKENHVPSIPMDGDAWMAARQVPVFNDALGINTGTTTSSLPERNFQDLGSENGPLADWQGRTPLATGVWSNGAFNVTPDHEMVPGWTTSQDNQERRVIVAEPGGQTPGITVNGVALRLPKLKLPLYNPSGIASGSNAQEISTKVSAGTSLMAERKAACMLRKVYADSK
jgi:hypothetical protein